MNSSLQHVYIHTQNPPSILDAHWLRQLCRDAGSHDVGFVELARPALAPERPHIEKLYPRTRSLISIVVRMNRDNIRSPARSVANHEFHETNQEADHVAHRIVAALERHGVRALCPPSGFPMEAGRWMTERIWVVAHKPVAVAAGLGRMGIHRNVIHPRFGNFILLGTILLESEISAYDHELDYNPCLTCKLCVAACPVGAIGVDGRFNFSACYTHNYREFMGGFTDWVEQVVGSKSVRTYRKKVEDSETVSMWQSLSYGPNYKAAYCMAVCPAGDEVIAQYQLDKEQYLEEVVRPLQAKVEPLYVIRGSDAEAHAQRRFPHKQLRYVASSLRPQNIQTFLGGLPNTFQSEASAGLIASFHFTFTGTDAAQVTVKIADKQLTLEPGLLGEADLRVIADGSSWLRFLRGETHILWELVRRRIRVQGPIRLLRAFAKCFPT